MTEYDLDDRFIKLMMDIASENPLAYEDHVTKEISDDCVWGCVKYKDRKFKMVFTKDLQQDNNYFWHLTVAPFEGVDLDEVMVEEVAKLVLGEKAEKHRIDFAFMAQFIVEVKN